MLYLIIYGTRGVTSTAAEGQFHCPRCGPSAYRHRRVRRFFTLYFIPLIPLDKLGEYVECGRCAGTYEVGVLAYDPAAEHAEFEAHFHAAVRRTMVLMSLADGVVTPQEVATIQHVFGSIVQRPISDQEVLAEVTAAQADGRPVGAFLAGMAPTLNDVGKGMVIRAAYMVAAADGQFQAEEQQLMTDIGRALQMTPEHLRGVIDAIRAEGAPS